MNDLHSNRTENNSSTRANLEGREALSEKEASFQRYRKWRLRDLSLGHGVNISSAYELNCQTFYPAADQTLTLIPISHPLTGPSGCLCWKTV